MRKSTKPKKTLEIDLHTVRVLDHRGMAGAFGGSGADSDRCSEACPTAGCGTRDCKLKVH